MQVLYSAPENDDPNLIIANNKVKIERELPLKQMKQNAQIQSKSQQIDVEDGISESVQDMSSR